MLVEQISAFCSVKRSADIGQVVPIPWQYQLDHQEKETKWKLGVVFQVKKAVELM